MDAERYLREGRPREALAELQGRVRKNPANTRDRIFLFQLLAVLGQWDRAMNQLKVIGEIDAGALAMVQTYREALRCEALRAEVFAGRRAPLVFGDPEQWVALLLEALRLTASGDHAQAQELREQAFEAAPATAGNIDGQPFQWVADADPRLGPTLEAVINGRYYWIPFQRIREIRIDEPADLRDVVWMPAYFVWANEGETVGLIPTRYPGSESSEDGQLCMARKTDWNAPAPELQIGLGQRMLATDVDDYPLMAVRAIELSQPSHEAVSPEDAADSDGKDA
jgi:type VI secretion system protein ImpE